ncbi:MAG: O-antigen ligase family protein [Alphaproteobacteria bacterium]|jgi:O-antigen ligase|nr:O-antigen ligase family protein [Alphaproteobacteria bacterium]MDP6516036.1 O-antigen ligase family protein [Alphaproteobacteria bacterium]
MSWLDNGRIVGSAAALALPLAALAPLGLAPLLIAVGLAGLFVIVREAAWTEAFARPGAALLAAVLAWALLSLWWSADQSHGGERWLRLTLITICGLSLTAVADRLGANSRHLIKWTVIGGLVAGMAFLAFDFATDAWLRRLLRGAAAEELSFGPSTLNRAGTVLVLLIWAPLACLWGSLRGLPAAALVGACTLLLWRMESNAALLALALGVGVMAATAAAPRATTRVLALVCATAILLAPVLPHTLIRPAAVIALAPGLASPSVHRLYIWQFAAARIAAHPVRGWGFDASRHVTGGDVPIGTENQALGADYAGMTMMPLHPHNAVLQVWLELGLPGGLLLAALCANLLLAIGRRSADRPAAAAAAAGVITALMVSGLSYGAWQNWWLATLWLAAAISLAIWRRDDDAEGPA